jgi:hypothetical protein
MLRLFEESASHIELDARLIREGLITRPAAASDYDKLDRIVTGRHSNGDHPATSSTRRRSTSTARTTSRSGSRASSASG